MPRPARFQQPGAVYHVTTRGNRKSIIYEDDQDRLGFLRLIARAAARYELKVHSACLMGTHYHIVCSTPRGNISDTMHYINGAYAQASNRRHDRTGHLFERGFRSLVIEREGYLRRAVRYVDLNPVRARLTANPEAWRWNTYRFTAGLRPAPPWLDCEWLEEAFVATTRREAQLRYRIYVNQPLAKIAKIDTTALALGSEPFCQAMTAAVYPRTDRPLPRKSHAITRPSLAEVLAGIGVEGRHRDDAIRLAHEDHGYRLSEIARHLGVDRSTASKALRRLLERSRQDELILSDWLDD